VASTDDAGVLVEGNYFLRVKAPTHTRYGDSKQPGRIVARGNVTVESGAVETAGAVGDPPYPYTLDDANALPELVAAGAGVGQPGAGSK